MKAVASVSLSRLEVNLNLHARVKTLAAREAAIEGREAELSKKLAGQPAGSLQLAGAADEATPPPGRSIGRSIDKACALFRN